MEKRKVGIYTLGCRVNQYESDAIAEQLRGEGYEIADFDGECDVYVINTCTVTAESDRKCRQVINRALRRKTGERSLPVVAVLGCYCQKLTPERQEALRRADYIGGNGNKTEFARALPALLNGESRRAVRKISALTEYEPMSLSHSRNVRAHVKIEDGCNHFCSYCLVPYVRGRVRSRGEEDILNEVRRLAENGYREIVLTGIETAAYGEDRGEREALAGLLERIARDTGMERIRIGSLNPELFTESFTRRLAGIAPLLPHFHLSAQSASDRVLHRMRRRYDRDGLYRAVDNIRSRFDNAALSADLICGFPGETEEDFAQSMDFVSYSRLLHAHVFPYSVREGTRAAGMDGQLAAGIRKERAERMIRHAEAVRADVLREQIGRPFRVLVESRDENHAYGYTENYIHTRLAEPWRYRVGEIYPIVLGEGDC